MPVVCCFPQGENRGMGLGLSQHAWRQLLELNCFCQDSVCGHVSSTPSSDGKRLLKKQRGTIEVAARHATTGELLSSIVVRQKETVAALRHGIEQSRRLPEDCCDLRLQFGERVLADSEELVVAGLYDGAVVNVTFCRTALLVTASADRTAKVWSATTGRCILTLSGSERFVNSASFSPDGLLIVTASADRTAKVWSTETGECTLTLEGHEHFVNSAMFSPDGQTLVTASYDGFAKVWDAVTGDCTLTVEGHTGFVNTAAFSPDGEFLVTASNDRTAKVWSIRTGVRLQKLVGHMESVLSASFSPDGEAVVTASKDQSAKVWKAQSGKCDLTLRGHEDMVISASFSPGSREIVTASYDGTAKLWSAETGLCILTFSGHEEFVNSAAFSPGGDAVVTASADGLAKGGAGAAQPVLRADDGSSDAEGNQVLMATVMVAPLVHREGEMMVRLLSCHLEQCR